MPAVAARALVGARYSLSRSPRRPSPGTSGKHVARGPRARLRGPQPSVRPAAINGHRGGAGEGGQQLTMHNQLIAESHPCHWHCQSGSWVTWVVRKHRTSAAAAARSSSVGVAGSGSPIIPGSSASCSGGSSPMLASVLAVVRARQQVLRLSARWPDVFLFRNHAYAVKA